MRSTDSTGAPTNLPSLHVEVPAAAWLTNALMLTAWHRCCVNGTCTSTSPTAALSCADGACICYRSWLWRHRLQCADSLPGTYLRCPMICGSTAAEYCHNGTCAGATRVLVPRLRRRRLGLLAPLPVRFSPRALMAAARLCAVRGAPLHMCHVPSASLRRERMRLLIHLYRRGVRAAPLRRFCLRARCVRLRHWSVRACDADWTRGCGMRATAAAPRTTAMATLWRRACDGVTRVPVLAAAVRAP